MLKDETLLNLYNELKESGIPVEIAAVIINKLVGEIEYVTLRQQGNQNNN